MANQLPWDDNVDMFIKDLDTNLIKKYGFGLRNLFLNPEKYIGKENILDTITNMKNDADTYFSDVLEDYANEQKNLDVQLETINTESRQIDEVITNKAAVARVPYIKPMLVNRNVEREETIIIEHYDEKFDQFIGKMINGSDYIADVSTPYKQYAFGAWLFSGAKNYVLALNPPTSPIITINTANDTINRLIGETTKLLG